MPRKIVLIVSLAAGVLAAVVTNIAFSAKEAEVEKAKKGIRERYGTIDAVVFYADVPAGTVLSSDDLGTLSMPALGLRGQAVEKSSYRDVLGRRLVAAHKRGEVLFWSDVEGGDPSAKGLSADIKKNMRAVSVNCSGAASVSGMVKPNDHVDVIGTFSFPKPAPDGKNVLQELVTCTILQNVLVLATGKETSKSGSSPFGNGSYSTVTLEVSPREAEMLVFAEQIRGRLVLSLRNRNDTSYEKELPQVDFEKIRSEIEDLNAKRQAEIGGGH